jgi:hypothetical protein
LNITSLVIKDSHTRTALYALRTPSNIINHIHDTRTPKMFTFFPKIGSHFGEGALFGTPGVRGATCKATKNAENTHVFAMALDRRVHLEMMEKFPAYEAYWERNAQKIAERMRAAETRDDRRRQRDLTLAVKEQQSVQSQRETRQFRRSIGVEGSPAGSASSSPRVLDRGRFCTASADSPRSPMPLHR